MLGSELTYCDGDSKLTYVFVYVLIMHCTVHICVLYVLTHELYIKDIKLAKK